MCMRMLFFVFGGMYEKTDRLFFQGRADPVGRVLGPDPNLLPDLRPGEYHDIGCIADRHHVPDLQRQGQPHRASSDDPVQSALRADLLHLFLLRGDDYVSRHDRAHGTVCFCFLAAQSLQGQPRRGGGEPAPSVPAICISNTAPCRGPCPASPWATRWWAWCPRWARR